MRPSTPALTPTGLHTWLTAFIQASPGPESERLSRVLLDAPLETDAPGADHKPERLPKQLSRHLLPSSRNDAVHEKIVTALDDWNKRMGITTPEPSSPSWGTLLADDTPPYSPPLPPLPRVNSVSMARREREKIYDPDDIHRRDSTQHTPQPVTVSPANTGRPRLRQREKYPSSPATSIHVTSHPRQHAKQPRDDDSKPRSSYSHHSGSERARHRSSRDTSPDRTKHSSRRHRDRSPKAQRADSRDRHDCKGRYCKKQDAPARHHASSLSSSHDARHANRRAGDSPASWGRITPDRSPARTESYRIIHGRGAGPQHGEFLRDRERIAV